MRQSEFKRADTATRILDVAERLCGRRIAAETVAVRQSDGAVGRVGRSAIKTAQPLALVACAPAEDHVKAEENDTRNHRDCDNDEKLRICHLLKPWPLCRPFSIYPSLTASAGPAAPLKIGTQPGPFEGQRRIVLSPSRDPW